MLLIMKIVKNKLIYMYFINKSGNIPKTISSNAIIADKIIKLKEGLLVSGFISVRFKNKFNGTLI